MLETIDGRKIGRFASADDLSTIDDLPPEFRLAAHMLLAARNKVREARRNEPFQDWTIADIIAASMPAGAQIGAQIGAQSAQIGRRK